jgi:hypothetical protein
VLYFRHETEFQINSFLLKKLPIIVDRLTCLQAPQGGRKLPQEAVTEEGPDELLLAR